MPVPEHIMTQESASWPVPSALPPALRAALLDPAAWQDGLYKFSLATNLAVALIDAEGRSLTFRNPQPLWSLFRRKRPAGQGECPFALAPVQPCTCVAKAVETSRWALAADRTGLAHFAVPLMLGEDRLGALLAGQVFTQYPEQLVVERVAEQFGLPPGRAWQRARREHPIRRATLEVYADLLATLGQTFLQTQYHSLTEAARLAEMTRLRDQAVAENAERKLAEEALRESEERFRQLAENIRDVFWITECPERRISYVSPAYERLWGFDPNELYRDYDAWIRAIHPEDRERAQRTFRDKALAGTFDEEYRMVMANGSVRWIRDRCFPLRDERGEVYRLTGIAQDITAHKQTEETLQEAGRRKDEFLAMLAHELRGPLAPIRNMLEIMKRADGKDDLIQQARDTMERQLGQMVRLVDDLLDVSRISRGRIELKRERVELTSVVYQAVEACRPLAESAKHEVKVTLPPEPIYLHADPVRLAQVFSNLLNNSCSTPSRGARFRSPPSGTAATWW
jgi:PAS domain S-box-containing protein